MAIESRRQQERTRRLPRGSRVRRQASDRRGATGAPRNETPMPRPRSSGPRPGDAARYSPPGIVHILMRIDLSIVIVNWNTGDLLRRCVAAIVAAAPAIACDVIVVDNASSDASLARLRSDDAAAALLRDGRLRI